MGMIVTIYLISANIYNSVDAPKNRGFSYIEIWMIGSQFPISLALLEYGFVLFLKKVVKISNQNEANIFDKKIKMLDMVTMIFNFCFFVIFTLIYWIAALTLHWLICYPKNFTPSVWLRYAHFSSWKEMLLLKVCISGTMPMSHEWFCTNSYYVIHAILIPSSIADRLCWHSCVFKPAYWAAINVGPRPAQIAT